MANIYSILIDNNSFYVGGSQFNGYDNQENGIPLVKFSSQTKTQLVELIYDGNNFIGTHSVDVYVYKPIGSPAVPA